MARRTIKLGALKQVRAPRPHAVVDRPRVRWENGFLNAQAQPNQDLTWPFLQHQFCLNQKKSNHSRHSQKLFYEEIMHTIGIPLTHLYLMQVDW